MELEQLTPRVYQLPFRRKTTARRWGISGATGFR